MRLTWLRYAGCLSKCRIHEQKGHPWSVTVRGQHGADGGVDSAVRAAVEAFGKVLGEVLELVMGCQELANDMCLCCTCTSGKLSKQSN